MVDWAQSTNYLSLSPFFVHSFIHSFVLFSSLLKFIQLLHQSIISTHSQAQYKSVQALVRFVSLLSTRQASRLLTHSVLVLVQIQQRHRTPGAERADVGHSV